MESSDKTILFKHQSASIGIMPIVDGSEQLLSQLERKEWYLPEAEKMSEHRKQEWLAVRVLLKRMLGGEEKEIRYYPSGKPYLADNTYHISISHTKGYVAVILDSQNKVAIDIEYLSPRVEKIQERFLSDEEKDNLSPTLRLIHLILHWSAKESLFKYLDEENIEFKSQLHLFPFEPITNKWSTFTARETRTKEGNTLPVHYLVTENAAITFIDSSIS